MTLSAKSNRLFPLHPNILSLLRGALGILLPFLLAREHGLTHLFAAFLFVLGVATDYWDGWIARRDNRVSDVGKLLDPAMDKILILAPLAAFSQLGFYSPWWIVPVFAREIAVTFCRIGWMMEGRAVGAENLGKLKFGFQAVLVGLCFLLLFSLDYSWPFALAKMLRLLLWVSLAGSVLLTLVSGASFFLANRDLLKTTGFARYTSALGVGLLPVVPGTWGSLLGLVLVYLVSWNAGLYLGVFLVLVLLGRWAVGRLDLNKEKDPFFVTVDEACGIFVTFFRIPLHPFSAILGFVLFRVFDVIKPYPVRKFEKLPGYWGILTDDLAAGVYAWLILKITFG